MVKKPGRNDPCFCGSGKKYKKCCMKKEDEKPTVSIKQALDVLSFGLSKLPIERSGETHYVNLKNLSITNSDTVTCEFFADASDAINIKAEMCYIVSSMFSFFKENPDFVFIKNYAAKAFSKDDKEILSAISSSQTAQYISEGKSIEWYKNTIFIENTDDHRLQQAKQKIATIEKGLRSLICNLLQNKSGNWWNELIPENIKETAEQFFEDKFGYSSTSGTELLEFTFLINLKTIIVSNWSCFESIFSSKKRFKYLIGKLNEIRKEEAHNRTINDETSGKLSQLYDEVLGSISKEFPDIVPAYLVDNWHIKLKEILEGYTKTIVKTKEGEKSNLSKIFLMLLL
jgi:SEC-C motif